MGHIDFSKFASASATSEWARKAKEFLADHRYGLAAQAFHMARLFHDADIAKALHLREQAELVPVGSRPEALRKATEAFKKAAHESCSDDERFQLFCDAAGCLLEIPDIQTAASTYVEAHAYTRAVQLFRSIAKFNSALRVVHQHHGEIESATAENVTYAARLYYFQQSRIT